MVPAAALLLLALQQLPPHAAADARHEVDQPPPHHNGMGCQPLLKKYCPSYSPEGVSNVTACLACIAAEWPRLKANCTRTRAENKCTGSGPAPSPPPAMPLPPVPPAPPLPPLPPAAGAPRPHLVLFVVDDMGWAALGKRNPGNVFTPNMDREATNGIMLERHYAYRWCSPTRSSLMTGRLPYHVLQSTNYVDRRFNMMAAKLKQVGCESRREPGFANHWAAVHASD